MKDKEKNVARVKGSSSQDPRNPRKGNRKPRRQAETIVPLDRRVTDLGPVQGPAGRWALADRVVDTVDLLYRRRMIDQRQRMAGSTYRDAVDAVGGSTPCALDMSRVHGGGGGGAPIPSALWGAETMAQAKRVLGDYQGRAVASVLAEGHTIEDTARRMMGGKASQRDVEFVGRLFREGLTALADLWFPVVRARMNAVLAPGAKPTEVGGGAIEPGHVVHATSDRIFDTRK